MATACTNCGDTKTEVFKLEVWTEEPKEAYLCDTCRDELRSALHSRSP